MAGGERNKGGETRETRMGERGRRDKTKRKAREGVRRLGWKVRAKSARKEQRSDGETGAGVMGKKWR